MAKRKIKLIDMEEPNKPRERLRNSGADALTEEDLLAVVVGRGTKGTDVLELSRKVLAKVDLRLLDSEKDVDVKELLDDMMQVDGVAEAKALQIIAAVALGKVLQIRHEKREHPIREAKDVYNIFQDLRNMNVETLSCLYLNARNVTITREDITKGLLDKSLFHPREVFAKALEVRAANIIVVHNHPSGNPSPSDADRKVVRRLVDASKVLGVEVLDFIIVAKHGYYSYLSMVKQGKGLGDTAELAQDANVLYVGESSMAPTETLLDYYDSL